MHNELAIGVLVVTTMLMGLIDALFFSKVLQPKRPMRFIVLSVLFSFVLAMGFNMLIRTWAISTTGIYWLSAANYVIRVAVLLLLSKARFGQVLFAFASVVAGFVFVEAILSYFGLLTGIVVYGGGYFREVEAYADLESVTLDTGTVLYFLGIYLCTLLLYGLLIYSFNYLWKMFVRSLSYERLKLFVWVPVSHVVIELSLNLYLGEGDWPVVVYFLNGSTVVFGVPMELYFLSDALSIMFAGVTATTFYILWKLKELEELGHVRQLVRNQLEAQARQYAQLSEQEQAVRMLHHDAKNIEATALAMADQGDDPGAVQLLKQSLERLK